MGTLEQNLKIARSVLDKTNKKIKTSNDIIPRVDLPVPIAEKPEDYKNQKEGYRKRFESTYPEIVGHLSIVNAIRKYAIECAQELELPPSIVDNTIALTTAEFGMGECGEAAVYAATQLASVGMAKEMRMIGLENANDIHAFVLIGGADLAVFQKNISCFKQLPENAVLLDPFLRIVCPANKYEENPVFMAYLNTFKLERIFSEKYIAPMCGEDIQFVNSLVKTMFKLCQEKHKPLKDLVAHIQSDKASNTKNATAPSPKDEKSTALSATTVPSKTDTATRNFLCATGELVLQKADAVDALSRTIFYVAEELPLQKVKPSASSSSLEASDSKAATPPDSKQATGTVAGALAASLTTVLSPSSAAASTAAANAGKAASSPGTEPVPLPHHNRVQPQ